MHELRNIACNSNDKEEVASHLIFLRNINSRYSILLNDFKKTEMFYQNFLQSGGYPVDDIIDAVEKMSDMELYIIRSNMNYPKTQDDILPSNRENIEALSVEFLQYFFPRRNLTRMEIEESQSNVLQTRFNSSNLSVNETDVEGIISELSTSVLAGPDNIPSYIVKTSASYIIPVLTHLINLSFEKKRFPSLLKQSLIKPMFTKVLDDLTDEEKLEAKNNIENYHPIVLQSIFSKLFEQAMNGRLLTHISTSNLLEWNHQQTNLGLFEVLHQFYVSIDRKRHSFGIFIDLTKIYDMINHNLLLSKLEIYGIEPDWFKSYLKKRQQIIRLYNEEFVYDVQAGLPRGSLLGSTLFLIYITDLIQILIKRKINIAVIDTYNLILSITADNYNTLKDETANIIEDINNWMFSNKLSLTEDNFKFLHFCNENIAAENRQLRVRGRAYNLESWVEFSGIVIDEKLTWDKYVTDLCQNLTKLGKRLEQLTKSCSADTLRTFYNCSFLPCVQFLIPFWGFSKNIDNVHKCLEYAVRTILKIILKNFTEHNYGINNFHTTCGIYLVELIRFVRENEIKFTKQNSLHRYPTRTINLVVPKGEVQEDNQTVQDLQEVSKMPENVSPENSKEIVTSQERITQGKYAPKRYVTTCYFQPKQLPVWYSETMILNIGSTKKKYFESIYYENKLSPFHWTESMTTIIPDAEEPVLVNSSVDIPISPPECHYISLEPQQIAAMAK
ncbi:Reverse transcriptase (RNA-dependent DNA polymerase) [Popillia japonica]|uniref:Reverse transcriptase (RNA-dependent DNA polymerase) n=1 Tax=Popillia japonica TaxID=7064 RepID=A0AAW1JJ77_POPJA